MSLGPAEIVVLLATALTFGASRRFLEPTRPALTRVFTPIGIGGGRRVRRGEGST